VNEYEIVMRAPCASLFETLILAKSFVGVAAFPMSVFKILSEANAIVNLFKVKLVYFHKTLL